MTLARVSAQPCIKERTVATDPTEGLVKERNLFELFSAQCQRDGARIAVECGRQLWAYSVLHRKAIAVSQALLAAGLKEGQPVQVTMRRSFDLLAAVLGVVRAGGAFVLVDPALPIEKMRSIARHLDAGLWLTSRDMRMRLPDIPGKCIAVDEIADLAPDSNVEAPVEVDLDSCAYIVYTSGTTGEPKGVMISHRSLLNYLQWAVQSYFSDTKASGALLHTSISFDLTFTSLLAPLLLGQRIVVVSEEVPAQSVADLLGLLAGERRFALLKLTPSHLVSMSHIAEFRDSKFNVASVVVGGEAFSGKMAAWAQEHFPDAAIFNEYGPTETTVGCICYRIGNSEQFADQVPIGMPIAGTHCYVLDASGNPAPAGSAGELYIGGAGVGLGYYRNPELSASVFSDDPFKATGRLYRSGDRVRRLASGNLEFLDRIDRQVKIRGHRVELMEVESLLAKLPDVEQAVVVDVRSPGDSALRLVAFIRTTAGTLSDAQGATFNEYLAERLPAAAVPVEYLPVARFKLATSGKIDYEALRQLANERGRAQEQRDPPADDLEKTLTEIWRNVLNLQDLGVNDNYFAVGGDSIRSIRIASEAQRRGLELSVADVQRYATIRKLASAVRDKLTANVRPMASGPFCLLKPEDRALIPAGIEDAYPLNLLQEGMIYHRAFSPKSAVYHAMLGLHLRGEFDVRTMRRALQELVDRHPVLRTEFDLHRYSRPLQLVHADVPAPIEFYDLRDLSPDQHRLAVQAWMDEEKRRGFEFNQVPLIRFAVHQFAADRFHLIFSYHHEIVDGWSEATMTSQLLNHYFSLMSHVSVTPQKPRSTFRDAIVLERQALEGEEHKAFWAGYLQNATLIRLPRLLSGPKADKGLREIVKKPVIISEPLSDNLKALARQLGVPISTVLLCAHMFVLRQYSSYDDVLTHMVSNGRPEDDDGQNALGLFVNSFTFRLQIGHGTWASAIASVKKEEERSIAFRRYPMAELKRHQGSEPLSETLFFFTNYHVYQDLDKWRDAELLDTNLYGESTFPFCAISKMNPFTGRLQLRIEYDLLQFAPELIDSMAGCYVRILQQMVDQPHQQFRYHSLLSEKERGRIVGSWNARALIEPSEESVSALLEKFARMTPDAVALVQRDQYVTYAELNRCSNRLARYLVAEGLRVEDKVAISLNAPIDMIVAMMAVLKAGGSYIPLGANYDDARSISIVEDARARMLLTDSENIGKYVPFSGRKIVLDEHRNKIAAANDSDMVVRVSPDNAAYTIYTSGSSGKPKGVVVTRRNLAWSTAARRQYYGGGAERAVLVSPFCFDSSVATIYGALTSGATLMLFRDQNQFELGDLEAVIRDNRATSLLCIPNLYGSMLDSAGEGLAGLSRIIVAGEVCPKELYDLHRKLLPQVEFYNEYGPTEATVWSTVWKGGTSKTLTQIPIGQVVPGAQVYILNSDLLPLPVGVQGEICIGGPGIARGYDRNPATTAESFVPDPFSNEPGARLYRTRDLGRFLLDGSIEFLGRRDQQIKIQGFRVEIGEVEAIINGFDKVKRALVHAVADRDGQKMLVAYVVPRHAHASFEAELRHYVRDRLPKYMHPRNYVVLHELPVTEAGKIDYDVLTETRPEGEPAREIVGPRDSIEECILGIWSQALGAARIGIHDGFFDAGGESLRAMQIASRVKKVFGVTIPMENLVIHGASVAEISSYVKQHSGVGIRGSAREAMAATSH